MLLRENFVRGGEDNNKWGERRDWKMVMWVFGYGSLIWKAGFNYDERLIGCIKGYRRVFYQGSTDHRGTPAYPGRVVTLEHAEGEVCIGDPMGFLVTGLIPHLPWHIISPVLWDIPSGKYSVVAVEVQPDGKISNPLNWGVAYKISGMENEQIALTYLEVREKQYDTKAYVDFFTDPMALNPAVSDVMVYIASPDKKLNPNYLGPASLEEIAKQIIIAEGPSGPNRDYLFQLEKALIQFGFEDKHVMDLANEVRRLLPKVNGFCP